MDPVGDLALRILDRKRQQRTDTCSEAAKEETLLASMLKGNMQTLPLNPRIMPCVCWTVSPIILLSNFFPWLHCCVGGSKYLKSVHGSKLC